MLSAVLWGYEERHDMKLHHKKTDRIIDLDEWNMETFGNEIILESFDGEEYYCYESLAELNEEWEDNNEC